MNFSLSEDHTVLRDAAADFLRDQVDLAPLLVPGADAQQAPYDALWAKLCELGWPAMAVPEAHGGLGMSEIDVAIVLRECGRTLAPTPLLGTLAGTWALLAAGSPEQQTLWLPQVAEAGLRMALATAPASGDAGAADADVMATLHADGSYRLSGSSHFVIDAPGAQLLVVAAMLDGAKRLFLVQGEADGIETEWLAWRDITRQVAHVHVKDAVGDLMPGDWDSTWPTLRNRLHLALAAESAGGLQAVLDDTTAYVKERVAFGRPIGAYQSIKHGLADMLAQTECTQTAVLYAAWAQSQDERTATLASAMAQAYASEAYRDATHRSIQMFGAIGFTWEMKNHLYFKRARANAEWLGSAAEQRELIARTLETAHATPH
ncbi:acyl-CoA dehydrogenase family protein [Hydrogenophaga sp. BPS33]|uniref:acyl-CoA dehydrogenase family protein n=1 Tax=Hydrogenophaga sp. BPS33 TaxID=2651974 RepID=UPI00131FF0C5|nr:acyl-CoA dehydrogenase family protein [Hydrogenophaga sp. BPS33]QHE84180.1 acyl-CoA dehydrogenase [Hydrogenophaga sp. BPS33]